MSNAEEGIAKTQLKSGATVAGQQSWGIAYIDERIFIYLGAIAFVGLCVVWAAAKSAWIIYGSFALTILMVILWGVARIKRLERVRQERAAEAQSFSSQTVDESGSESAP